MNTPALIVLAVLALVSTLSALALLLRLLKAEREAALQRGSADLLKQQVEQERQRLRAAEDGFEKRLADQDAAWRQRLDEKEADCIRLSNQSVETLREQFARLAQEKLKTSSEGLSEMNQKRIAELMAPFREQIEGFRKAFEENRRQQAVNKASFDQAIKDLGDRALQIGADAENLAKALKNESKTQGDWGEMVLANILSAAGLKEGLDFFPQVQEVDGQGNKLIPDVEIPLPNKEKLLVDSKASVTAYLDYVAATDEAARALAVKAHVASVRKHMDELADKDYIKKVKGSQGYILMFIPNEGSYLLAMEHDRKMATDAFRKHVIIVNPTTLLLCLQIVALLRSREAQNENAERISAAAARMYEKFAGFSETFAELGKRLDGLAGVYRKANGQLCEGPANVVKQLEALKGMGVVTAKTVNGKLLAEANVEV